MTRTDTRPGTVGVVSGIEPCWRLDPDVAAFFDDIDEILCEALARQPCPPPPRVISTGFALAPTSPVPAADPSQPRSRNRGRTSRATQRAPPTRGCTVAFSAWRTWHCDKHERTSSKGR
ncbi:hypothetical protein [Antrihabitans stalactiti]|uniref:Uncharacterized protein n=1 Tax=Antrihabitans stalactiti TaxID=2584121 RepID=A0A848KFD2_9NOCA|nr:hypothetical protein [Antrihabitans stalactiti]NMN95844.1 hypothetical protein [Antrihabitans stalactiti]